MDNTTDACDAISATITIAYAPSGGYDITMSNGDDEIMESNYAKDRSVAADVIERYASTWAFGDE